MEDADSGGASPSSAASEPANLPKSGHNRRGWRNTKTKNLSGNIERFDVAGASGAAARNKITPGLTPVVPYDAAIGPTTRVESQPSAGANSGADTGQSGQPFEQPVSKRKSRRRRRRRGKGRARQAQLVSANSATSLNTRHRRRPVSPEAPATFKNITARQRTTNSQNAPSAQAATGNQKHDQTRVAKPPRTYYAALDLGTNNCRLLITIPQAPGRFRVVDAFSRIVRLGEGLGTSGKLSDAAMDRTVDALKICADKLRQRPQVRHRLIATEACRRAQNGRQFLDRVLEETGLELEIVDRATEARLAVSGCGPLIDNNADGVVLFDIGGGSSELALLDTRNLRRRRLSEHIVSWTSLPLGVVTLSEKFGGGRHVTPQIFEDMVVDVAGILDKYEGRNALAHASKTGRFHLLGTSGTVTTLAGVHFNLPRYDRRRVDGAWLSNAEVDAMIGRILNMSFEERVNNPCIGADRADLVLAGCAILEAIRRQWPSPRLRVADRGLREGILMELMARDGVWRRRHKRPGFRNSLAARNNSDRGDPS